MLRQLKNSSRNIFATIIIIISDICAYIAGLLLAYVSRISVTYLVSLAGIQFTLEYFFIQLWWMFVIFITFIASMNLYSSRQPYWQESKKLFTASSMTFILVFAIVSLGKMSNDISRFLICLLWIYSTIFLILFRYLIKNYLFRLPVFMEKVIIVGSYEDVVKAYYNFSREKYLGFNIVGAITYDDKNKESKDCPVKILGSIKKVNCIVKKYHISVGIVIPYENNRDRINHLVDKLNLSLNKVLVLSNKSRVAYSNTETMQILDSSLSYMQINNNLKSLYNNIIKRIIDIVLSCLMLPVILLILLILSIAIKLTSKGPVFYRHKRVGRYGKSIMIFKFRSMYEDADIRLKEILEKDEEARKEWENSYKLKNDPRITPLGRFLRKTSLDELPQIFNVLQGDMSLIGPRPVLKEELTKYYKDLSVYYLMVKPGITGLWQISGRSDLGYDLRVERDSWYVLNWSLWLDIIILLKTPGVVLRRKGAY